MYFNPPNKKKKSKFRLIFYNMWVSICDLDYNTYT